MPKNYFHFHLENAKSENLFTENFFFFFGTMCIQIPSLDFRENFFHHLSTQSFEKSSFFFCLFRECRVPMLASICLAKLIHSRNK